MTKCTATTKAGTPCRFQAQTGLDYCIVHDPRPEAKAIRDRARSMGGKVRAGQERAQTTAPNLDAEEVGIGDAGTPDPLNFELPEDDKGEPTGAWWWWSLTSSTEVEEAIAYCARATMARRMTAREAQAAAQLLKPLLLSQQERERRNRGGK